MWDHKGKQYFASLFLFIMAYTYILFSQATNKFYTGACHKDLITRINNHNNGTYGSHTFTTQACDWKLFLQFELDDYPHAIRLERKIKSMKSSKYMLNLSKYPELREKIINETRSIWLSRKLSGQVVHGSSPCGTTIKTKTLAQAKVFFWSIFT